MHDTAYHLFHAITALCTKLSLHITVLIVQCYLDQQKPSKILDDFVDESQTDKSSVIKKATMIDRSDSASSLLSIASLHSSEEWITTVSSIVLRAFCGRLYLNRTLLIVGQS